MAERFRDHRGRFIRKPPPAPPIDPAVLAAMDAVKRGREGKPCFTIFDAKDWQLVIEKRWTYTTDAPQEWDGAAPIVAES